MKTNLLIVAFMAGIIILAMSACKSDKKEGCTNTLAVRDSLIIIREHNLAVRERALALNAATNNLATENDKLIPQSGSNIYVGELGGKHKKRMPLIINNRPKATEHFFAKNAGNYPEGSDRLLNSGDIAYVSHWGYMVMLNEIYARHGMSFGDEKLQRHFDAQKWYRSGRKNVDKSLSAIEKANIAFLNQHPK